jgi:hypothetical protein
MSNTHASNNATRIEKTMSATSQYRPPMLQVNGDPDEHQPGEDSRGPRLGQEEVVPFVHVTLLFVVVLAVREV